MDELKDQIMIVSNVSYENHKLWYQMENGERYWYHEDMLEPVEEKGLAENLGKTIDDAIKESPILIKQYADLQKKYNDLDTKYRELERETQYLQGKVDAYEKIIEED